MYFLPKVFDVLKIQSLMHLSSSKSPCSVPGCNSYIDITFNGLREILRYDFGGKFKDRKFRNDYMSKRPTGGAAKDYRPRSKPWL